MVTDTIREAVPAAVHRAQADGIAGRWADVARLRREDGLVVISESTLVFVPCDRAEAVRRWRRDEVLDISTPRGRRAAIELSDGNRLRLEAAAAAVVQHWLGQTPAHGEWQPQDASRSRTSAPPPTPPPATGQPRLVVLGPSPTDDRSPLTPSRPAHSAPHRVVARVHSALRPTGYVERDGVIGCARWTGVGAAPAVGELVVLAAHRDSPALGPEGPLLAVARHSERAGCGMRA